MLDFWERERQQIIDKNNFDVSPNDAGPLWLGMRLNSPKAMDACQGDTNAKGAYALQMLRSIMYDDQAPNGKQEQPFIDMMHDFTETHRNSLASTESFKAVVDKHVTKSIDLQRNGRLDWFFAE